MQDAIDLLIYGLTSSSAAWIALVFVISLLIGSFLNVVIHRVPIMLEREWRTQAEQIVAQQVAGAEALPPALNASPTAHEPYNLFVPRSACPGCGTMITAAQNIPVISYLFLKGKCAKCSAKISVRYPIVELARNPSSCEQYLPLARLANFARDPYAAQFPDKPLIRK